jgi:hypothetical protein
LAKRGRASSVKSKWIEHSALAVAVFLIERFAGLLPLPRNFCDDDEWGLPLFAEMPARRRATARRDCQ